MQEIKIRAVNKKFVIFASVIFVILYTFYLFYAQVKSEWPSANVPFTSVVSAGVNVEGEVAGALYDADAADDVEQDVDGEKLTHIFLYLLLIIFVSYIYIKTI